jgi:hypothetical protein
MKKEIGLRSGKTQGTSSHHHSATNTKQTTSQSHKKKKSPGTAIALDVRKNKGGSRKIQQQRKLLDTVATATTTTTPATNDTTAHTYAASKKKKTTEVETKKRRSAVGPKDTDAKSNIKKSNSKEIIGIIELMPPLCPRSTQLEILNHLHLELPSVFFNNDDDEEELQSLLTSHGDCERDGPPISFHSTVRPSKWVETTIPTAIASAIPLKRVTGTVVCTGTSRIGNHKAQRNSNRSSSTYNTKFGEEPFVLPSMEDDSTLDTRHNKSKKAAKNKVSKLSKEKGNASSRTSDNRRNQKDVVDEQQLPYATTKADQKDDPKHIAVDLIKTPASLVATASSSLLASSTYMFSSLGINSSVANSFRWSTNNVVPDQDQRRDNSNTDTDRSTPLAVVALDDLGSPDKDKVDHDLHRHMQDHRHHHHQRLQQMKESLRNIEKEEAILKGKINKEEAILLKGGIKQTLAHAPPAATAKRSEHATSAANIDMDAVTKKEAKNHHGNNQRRQRRVSPK